METFERYKLIIEKRWTEFLKSLEVGVHTFSFPTIGHIKSCKTIGYNLTTDKLGREYRFKVNKDERKVEITVRQM